ncbi:serine protease [Patescibacteria group bacterium]|nr:serine protease [Patescibacteria group bacterium]
MQFLFEILTAGLMGYLAFTNMLASQINFVLGTTPETVEMETEESEDMPATLSRLPSDYMQPSFIPDVLLQSADYQQASVISSIETDFIATNNPLEAIVNIYCTSVTSRQIRTTTGTGFFVHPSGVIMTNAHVAQFLLLEKTGVFGDTDCVIRNGSPASARYKAELLYIPPAWVKANASLVDDKAPSGTGERDYALLYIISDMDNEPIEKEVTFPALALNTDLLPRSMTEARVVAAGYPAGSLFTEGSDSELLARSAETTISELYTFDSNYADVFGMRGSIMGEQGASGGPVVADDGRVIGMVTTRGDDARDGAGSLRAITISHVNRTITEETGFSLSSNLSGDIPFKANVFTTTMAPFLTELLVAEIRR